MNRKKKAIVIRKKRKEEQSKRTTKFIGGSVLLFILLLLISSFVIKKDSSSFVIVTIKHDEAALLSNKDEKSEQISSVKKGLKLFLLEEEKGKNNENWAYISDGDIEGWIKTSKLRKRDLKEVNIIPKKLLSLNEKPSEKSKAKINVESEAKLQATAIQKRKSNSYWVKVKTEKKEGWAPIESIFIANDESLKNKSIVFLNKDVRVKEDKNQRSKTIASLQKGNRVFIKKLEKDSKKKKWYKINVEGKDGYILVEDTGNKLKVSYPLFAHEDHTPIFVKPSKKEEITDYLSYNQEVVATQELISFKNSVWYKVEYNGGKSGFIPVELLSHEKTKVAYLTFDDGPTDTTEQLLDILAQYEAKATFFMVEPHIRQYPEVVKRMIQELHAVGSHSVTHDIGLVYASKDSVVYEMKQGLDTIEEVAGVKSRLIRVPYGSIPHMTKEYLNAVNQHEMLLWDWNVDTNDWRYKNGQFIESTLAQVKRMEEKGEAPVILLHDQAVTVAAMPVLIEQLKKQGYHFEALNDSLTPIIFPR